MSTRIPAERTLPHQQEILERVLADQEQAVRRAGGRGWLVPVSAAAGIAVIVGGVVALGNQSGGRDAPVGGTSSAGTPSTPGAATSTVGTTRRLADISVSRGPAIWARPRRWPTRVSGRPMVRRARPGRSAGP